MSILLSKLRKALRPHATKGFTLTEVIVVLVVIAILAAILIPSFIAFIRHAQQTNRENIARTLYVAMQTQLTRATVEGNLHTVLTEDFYEADEYGNDQLTTSFSDYNFVGRVVDGLGVYFPENDIENVDNVYFISKPADYEFGSNEIVDKLYALLDEIIVNKEILDGAILMEFNVRTGVVMSIFYGDDLSGQVLFSYNDTDENSNVVGERGMDSTYPDTAYSRWQGYYGVDYTGVAPPLPIEDIVRIYDAMNYDDGTWQLAMPQGEVQYGLNVNPDASNPIREQNVLFAEFLLQNPLDDQSSLYIFDIDTNSKMEPELLSFDDTMTIYTDFRTAIEQSQYNKNHAVYHDTDTRIVINQYGVDVGALFNRYIWVLDFVEEDIFIQPNNIVTKYAEIIEPLNIRAGITVKDGPNRVSPMYANTHFQDKWPVGTYEVTSVRHLNNIRYVQDGDFIQTDHIDMRTLTNEMLAEVDRTPYNFKPIESFAGSYNASFESNLQWRIEFLRINTVGNGDYDNQDVGVFSTVEGNIIGMSLYDAEVIAPNATNVGSICGLLDGGQVIRSNSFANVVGGVGNTGGLIGRINNDGKITFSFNSGFFNTHEDTRTFFNDDVESGEDVPVFIGTGSVIAKGGNIGGLVGRNNGTILRCFNNARVNIEDVELDPETFQSINPTPTATPMSGTNLGGIAGLNESRETIEDCYATNFVAIYNEADINSGGIAGTNSGRIRNSRYIANGAADSGADWGPITRDVVSDISAGWMPEGFEINIIFHNAYDNGVHKNKYTQYPYPILTNNKPFSYLEETLTNPLLENREMGWEDIYDEDIIQAGALVYYEFYSDLAPRYVSPFSNTTIVPAGSPRYVTNDGYAIEFYPNNKGYLLEFGEGIIYKIALFEGEWRVFALDDDLTESIFGQVPDENWLPAEQFIPTANIPKNNEDNPVMYRIYIPNYLAFELADSPVQIGLFPDADTSIDEIDPEKNIMGRVNAPGSGVIESYNPLFANFSDTTSASIRSARHMDNINLVADNIRGVYTQHLNIDFAINYFSEITQASSGTYSTDTSTRRDFSRNAVVTERFAGRFVGTNMWIANLVINTPGAMNVGLFAENAGIVERVTLRLYSFTTDSIVGGTNVGGIVGNNLISGTVRSCFVQQVVTRDSRGQLPVWNLHPAAVKGTSNVGGVVGNNLGTLTDVIFTSTSARPAVSGVYSSSFGGIVGSTTNDVDNIMYLAVAPRIGTGRSAMRPFTGSGNQVGQNAVYLSGEPALRPFQTSIDGITASQIDYNLMVTGQKLLYPAMDSKEIVEAYSTAQFNNNWTMSNTAGINFGSMQLFPTFMYPFPVGTVPPTDREYWPVVASLPSDIPAQMGVIYYEKYEPSGIGIFARYIDSDGIERTIDYLRYDNPVIKEAGYGAQLPAGIGLNANKPVAYSQYEDDGWTSLDIEDNRLTLGNGGQIKLGDYPLSVPYLSGRTFMYLPHDLLVDAAKKLNNPIEPMIIWINVENANDVRLPGVYALINPFFAKEVYPITINGTGGNPNKPVLANLPQKHSTEHVIRTPWQLQNISLYNEKSATLCSDEHIFIQEIDIDMTILASTQAEPSRGLGVNLVSPPNTTTPVAQLPNIVRGTFRGVYDGQGNKIANLSLTYASANDKGLFRLIDTDGIVENLTIYDSKIQGGSDNGSIASVNNGAIKNVVFISAESGMPISQQPITGTGATGGIVGTNNGLIENALFLAQASGTVSGINPVAPITAAGTGTEINAYYLSGTYSSALRPSQTPISANYNIFSTGVVIRGEPRTTQELNTNDGFGAPWVQSNVPNWRNTMLGIISADNPYPYLGTSPTTSWPVATIPASDIVYYEEYIDGTVGFYSTGTGSGLPKLDDSLQITGYGYAVLVARPGKFGVSINVNAGNNTFVESTSRPGATVGNMFNYAKIPTSVVSGVSGEIYVNDQSTGRWIDARFAKAIYSSQSSAMYPSEVYIRVPQQMIQISNMATTIGVNITQERDLDFANVYLGNAMSVVTGIFNGTFDGGGNLISGLTINHIQPETVAQTSYVGVFSQNNGTISNVTLVFEGATRTTSPIRGNHNSISGSVMYVGSIAGQNTGTITDVVVISTILDSRGQNAIVPTGGNGSNVGGVAGDNSGEMTRVLYLAPAPVSDTRIYPITSSQTETDAEYVDVYYLGGEFDALIFDASTIPTTGSGSLIGPVNGFDYDGFTQPITGPVMVDTDGLYMAISNSITWVNLSPQTWTMLSLPPVYNFIYEDIYPYINCAIPSNQSVPTAWPVVSENVTVPPTESAEENMEPDEMTEGDLDDALTNNSDQSNPLSDESEPNGSVEQSDDFGASSESNASSNENGLDESGVGNGSGVTEESNDKPNEESTDGLDSFVIVSGIFTVFGGAGLTQTSWFRNYMRKRNARAVRKINEYNERRR